ncbi:hypothetical protein P5673_019811 [Acropora cervicornis]|uniref:Uncharacterized protein n=1 Tax=Acropora cervicornis TaxID=6130 RepID=A0AAD9V1H3_ACRCE|nr:hypothetical protein P5673_019811 [Acropora cervicornis]
MKEELYIFQESSTFRLSQQFYWTNELDEVSWAESHKEAKSGIYALSFYDEAGYAAYRKACEVGLAVDVVLQELSGGCPTSRNPFE